MQALRDLPDRQRYRTIARLAFLLLAAISAYVFAVLLQEEEYLWALVPGALIGLLSVFEFVLADIFLDSRFPRETAIFLERLQRKLSTTSTHDEILRVLGDCVDSLAGCDKERVTSTLHLTIETSRSGNISDDDWASADFRLHQVRPRRQAVASHEGDTRDRWTMRAPRGDGSCQLSYGGGISPADGQEFGFTRAEADRRTSDARSYLAVPVLSAGSLVGVMYFFSTEPQVFPVAADRAALDAER